MRNTWLHRYAIFAALCVLASILLGATVTSIEGLPTATPLAAAPVWLQTLHRASGEIVTLLIAALCVWLVSADKRGWLRFLGAQRCSRS